MFPHHTELQSSYVFSYPPEVFPVGLFWDIIFGVYFSLQGTKTSPLWDVFFAEHTCHLEEKRIKSLVFDSIRNVKKQCTSGSFSDSGVGETRGTRM